MTEPKTAKGILAEYEKTSGRRFVREEDGEELMVVNFGPAHPSAHGTLRSIAALSGEKILAAAVEIGYLHRGFEKMIEQGTWTQAIPYTDRLNYCSSLMNNHGYCKAVERLLGVEIPVRAKLVRVILSEISRIMDHYTCLGACLVDVGALTNFWYLYNAREKAYKIIEKVCGARLTTCHSRIGGLLRDVQEGFAEEVLSWLNEAEVARQDVLSLIKGNRIFLDRTRGVCAISGADAISYGFTGPCLRAAGIARDLRKDQPYDGYEHFDFEIPVGENGDVYDRLMVRFEEAAQSMRIIRQALDRLRPGPVIVSDPKIRLPEKEDVYFNIEAMTNHFELIMKGIQVPAGELYDCTEAANGELGFYIVSDGAGRPYRIKVRPPCFYIFGAHARMIEDRFIADAIASLGSLNIIAGELER